MIIRRLKKENMLGRVGALNKATDGSAERPSSERRSAFGKGVENRTLSQARVLQENFQRIIAQMSGLVGEVGKETKEFRKILEIGN